MDEIVTMLTTPVDGDAGLFVSGNKTPLAA